MRAARGASRPTGSLQLGRRAACVCAVALLATAGARAETASQAVTLFEPLGGAETRAVRMFPSALAAYPVRVQVDLLRTLDAGQDVVLPFGAGEEWRGTVQRVERRSAGSYSVFGTIEGSRAGWFIFTIDSGGLMAAIQIPERNVFADLRNLRDDEYALCTFDARKVGRYTCGVTGPADSTARFDIPPTESRYPIEMTITPPSPQHDVLVVYTQGLVNDFPNHFPNTPLDTAIQFLVDYANQCYANSGVQLHMRLAYRGLVDPSFSETGRDRGWLLTALESTTDGYLDNVHTLRSTYHADIVCLMYSYDTQAWVPPGTDRGGGLASLLGPTTFNSGNPALWYPSAFCVVEGLWQPSTFDPTSGMVPTEFTHEIGHTQGMGHDCADDPGVPVTSYAYGWRFTGNSGTKYVDVMSYLTGDYATATPIPYFGNPSVYYDGQPTGSNAPQCGGATTGANTAAALNLTADFMSRLRLNPLDPWVDFTYGGTQNGRFETPWMSFGSAVADLPYTDGQHTPAPPTITFKGPAATGTTVITMNKRMRVDAQGGAVRIGAP